jgi:hypothetical protein
MDKEKITISTNQLSSVDLPIIGNAFNVKNGIIQIPFLLKQDVRDIGVYDNILFNIEQLSSDINFVIYPSGTTAVSIINTSTNTDCTWLWEFNGYTANTITPPIQYSLNPTAYTISLTATNSAGNVKISKPLSIGSMINAVTGSTNTTMLSSKFNFIVDAFNPNNDFLKRFSLLNYNRGVSGLGRNINLSWNNYNGFKYDVYVSGNTNSNYYKTTIFDNNYVVNVDYTGNTLTSLKDDLDFYSSQVTGATTQGLTESTLFEFIKYGTGQTVSVGSVSVGKIVTSRSATTSFDLYTIKQSGSTNLYFYEYSATTGVTTYYQFTPNGLGRNDMGFSGLTKRDIMIGVIEQPKVNNHSFINRGKHNVFEPIARFCDVNTVNDVSSYNKNFFNTSTQQEK